MLIKICGVRDPEIASFSARAGAHFVGMILTPGFARSVSVSAAQAICQAVKEAGGEPVAVFVSETPKEVERICEETGATTVQFYKEEPLAAHLRRFYINESKNELRNGDHLLIESGSPGTGTRIDVNTFIRPASEFFLGGGLNPANIREMIELFRPSGVDVSSGVEKEGQKDKGLILEFIQKARSYA